MAMHNYRQSKLNVTEYSINRSGECQGTCFIISNEYFANGLSDRNGTQQDIKYLKETFSRLEFDIDLQENLTGDQIKESLLEISTKNHKDASMFICCILSHGQLDEVFGVDCVGVNVEKLMKSLEPCESLKSKPKLFFISACQDDIPDVEKDAKSTSLACEVVLRKQNRMKKSSKIELPKGSDFFLGMATLPGESSVRERADGTWFILHLCAKIDEYSDSLPLLEIYSKLQDSVSNLVGRYAGELIQQMPNIRVSTLRFPLRLQDPAVYLEPKKLVDSIQNQRHLHEAVERGNIDETKAALEQQGINIHMQLDKFTVMHIASRKGNIPMIELLLVKGADVNIVDTFNTSPLQLAVANNNLAAVQLLIKRGAKVNHVDKKNRTAISQAMEFGYIEIVKELLDKKADVHIVDYQGYSPLHFATLKDRSNIVSLLRDRGILRRRYVNLKEQGGYTALHLASQKNNVEVMEILFNNKADISCRNNSESTPLHKAAMNNSLEAVEFLLGKEVRLNDLDNKNATALHLACKEGHLDVVNALLLKGADINLTVNNGVSVVHLAASYNHVDLMKSLIVDHGASVNATNSNLWTPLHITCKLGNMEMLEFLLERKADLEMNTSDGCTPLHLAVIYNRYDIVNILLTRGAFCDMKTKKLCTPLYLACKFGYTEIANLLTEFDALGNTIHRTHMGKTPLHAAAYNDHLETVRFLINSTSLNVDVNAVDKHFMTPLHVASQAGHVNILTELLNSGADPKLKTDNGGSALHFAAQYNKIQAISFLISKGFNVDARNNENATALHFACIFGHEQVVEILLRKRASANVKTKTSQAPLHFASFYNHSKIVKLLIENGGTIDIKDDREFTPLHKASHQGAVDSMNVLLERGANVNCATNHGKTPLHIAVSHKRRRAVEILLSRNSDVHIKDDDKKTAIQLISDDREGVNIRNIFMEKGHIT